MTLQANSHSQNIETVGPTASPAVLSLKLSNFRCYEQETLTLHNNIIVLTGHNGAGKTNVLEAISMLSPGRGMRRAKLYEIDKKSQPSTWAIATTIRNVNQEIINIGTGRDPQAAQQGSDKRLVKIDGKHAKSQTNLANHLALTWLTPQMDRLFIEGTTERRRFFDRLVFNFKPDHALSLRQYEKAMRQRTHLLKNDLKGIKADTQWLDTLEQKMAQNALNIAENRNELAFLLDQHCQTLDGPFPAAHLYIEGHLENKLRTTNNAQDEVIQAFQTELKHTRRKDAEAGRALTGPHRSDLKTIFRLKNMPAEDCSTGEQKALLVSIILANARLHQEKKGHVPILLLDEVAAHLDQNRREALFEKIHSFNCQVWLTGTDKNTFNPLQNSAQFFNVQDGKISSNKA